MRPLLALLAVSVLALPLQGCQLGSVLAELTKSSAGSSAPAQATPMEEQAGGARAFVEPRGDNSIPTYGVESSSSERAATETALRRYLTARARGDWATACLAVASSLEQQLEAFSRSAKGCPTALRVLSAGAPASSRADVLRGHVVSLRVKGSNAFALFYGLDHHQYVMPMFRERGGWKVTQVAPVAYPLGTQTVQPEGGG